MPKENKSQQGIDFELKKKKKRIKKPYVKQRKQDYLQNQKSHDQNRVRKYSTKDNLKDHGRTWTMQENVKYAAFLQLHVEDFKNKKRLLYREWADFATDGNYQKIRSRLVESYSNWNENAIQYYASTIRQKLSLDDAEVQLQKFKLRQKENKLFRISSPQQLSKDGLKSCIENQQSYKLPNHKIKFFFGLLSQMFKPSNISFQISPYQKNRKQQTQKNYIVLINMDIEYREAEERKQLNEESQYIKNQLLIEPSESEFVTLKAQKMEIEQEIYQKIQKPQKFYKTVPNEERLWSRVQRTRYLTFLWAYRERFNFESKIQRSMFRRISSFVRTRDTPSCQKLFRKMKELQKKP